MTTNRSSTFQGDRMYDPRPLNANPLTMIFMAASRPNTTVNTMSSTLSVARSRDCGSRDGSSRHSTTELTMIMSSMTCMAGIHVACEGTASPGPLLAQPQTQGTMTLATHRNTHACAKSKQARAPPHLLEPAVHDDARGPGADGVVSVEDEE